MNVNVIACCEMTVDFSGLRSIGLSVYLLMGVSMLTTSLLPSHSMPAMRNDGRLNGTTSVKHANDVPSLSKGAALSTSKLLADTNNVTYRDVLRARERFRACVAGARQGIKQDAACVTTIPARRICRAGDIQCTAARLKRHLPHDAFSLISSTTEAFVADSVFIEPAPDDYPASLKEQRIPPNQIFYVEPIRGSLSRAEFNVRWIKWWNIFHHIPAVRAPEIRVLDSKMPGSLSIPLGIRMRPTAATAATAATDSGASTEAAGVVASALFLLDDPFWWWLA